MPSGYFNFGGYDMNTKEITVLMVKPGQHPKVTTIKDDLDSLQWSNATDKSEIFPFSVNQRLTVGACLKP